jgi:hypothetical protein
MKQRSLSPAGFRPIPRRGLSRTEAAIYIGIGPTKFDGLVADGRMPKPRKIDARLVWDIMALDDAFDALPGDESQIDLCPWDDASPASVNAAQARNECTPPIVFKPLAPGEWERQIRASPLGKRERAGLGAYYDARNEKLNYVKGAGIGTIERLEARGFIAVAEVRGDRVPFYRITPEGEAAWLQFQTV